MKGLGLASAFLPAPSLSVSDITCRLGARLEGKAKWPGRGLQPCLWALGPSCPPFQLAHAVVNYCPHLEFASNQLSAFPEDQRQACTHILAALALFVPFREYGVDYLFSICLKTHHNSVLSSCSCLKRFEQIYVKELGFLRMLNHSSTTSR